MDVDFGSPVRDPDQQQCSVAVLVLGGCSVAVLVLKGVECSVAVLVLGGLILGLGMPGAAGNAWATVMKEQGGVAIC